MMCRCAPACGRSARLRPSSVMVSLPETDSPSVATRPSTRNRFSRIQPSLWRREPWPAAARTFCIRSGTELSLVGLASGDQYVPVFEIVLDVIFGAVFCRVLGIVTGHYAQDLHRARPPGRLDSLEA